MLDTTTVDKYSLYFALLFFCLALSNLLLWIARARAEKRAEKRDREFQESLRRDWQGILKGRD